LIGVASHCPGVYAVFNGNLAECRPGFRPAQKSLIIGVGKGQYNISTILEMLLMN
jgi:hypothetical protein